MESGGSGVAYPSSEESEEHLSATETGTSETEPSHMEMSTTEPSKPETCEAKPKKAMKKRAKGSCRRRRRHRRRSRRHRRRSCSRPDDFPSFAIYFSRVLRQVHTGHSLSRVAVNVMDSFVKDMFEHIAEEAGRLARSKKRRTIITEDIQTAVRLVLPGEIYKFAMSEATKLLLRYYSYR